MKEFCFNELGYFTIGECETIKEKLEGYSYMNFHIAWSNYAGNCTLIIKTDYDAPEQEIKNHFLHCALSKLKG